jgi:DNA-binding transcriptional LysR family regulator
MDRFDAMSVLLEVVEAGSLSAAARRLGMPLATVSRRIADLEARLNARLFNRSSRRITLTDAGQAYAAAARRILDEVGEAERVAAGEYRAPKGELIVTAPIVFGRLHVLPVVLDFLRAYPEIDIRLVQADRVIDLMENHVDLAVRIADLPDSSLIAARVGAIRRVVCASPAYFAAKGTPQCPADLAGHDCITFSGLMASDLWTFAGEAPATIAVRSRLVVNTAEAAVDAAVAGLGITRVLSYQTADALRDGMVAIALRDFEPPPAPVSLVYTGQGLLPQKLRVFLDFAAPRLKARLAALPA